MLVTFTVQALVLFSKLLYSILLTLFACLFVCLFVYLQHNSKIAAPIVTKFLGSIGNVTRKNWGMIKAIYLIMELSLYITTQIIRSFIYCHAQKIAIQLSSDCSCDCVTN